MPFAGGFFAVVFELAADVVFFAVDDVVFFDPLGPEQLASIVAIQVEALSRRLAARRLTLDVTEAARDWLALAGYDPMYGARPLRRLVQSAIGDQLARLRAARRL